MKVQGFDFSGYATKVGKRCSDGRTILKDAFAKNDGQTVPLVWQHLHDEPKNILGHAILEHREDGVYTYCFFNDSEAAKNAKAAVAHKDIKSLSIFANNLVEKAKNVVHGNIREVSLVIAGANPEAFIDYIAFAHGDGTEFVSEEDAIIYSYEEIELAHAEKEKTDEEETIADVFETMSEKQKTVVYALISQALEMKDEELKQSDIEKEKGEQDMKKNIFDQNDKTGPTLTHDDMTKIVEQAKKTGSLREAFLAHAGATYGIENIDYLFPDPQNDGGIQLLKRRTEWVEEVFGKAHHSKFSRIKSLFADLTPDAARAKGYVKGNQKVDEVIALAKRVTTPQTVYKKQKLDRDDMIDITDFDVVTWLKGEMRLMLDEELARAVLVSDGRLASDDDKISETNIRPIYKDDPLYAIRVVVDEDATISKIIDAIVLARTSYEGSGNPVFFSTPAVVGAMLLLKDSTGRRIYNTVNDLAAALQVSKVVQVPVMERQVREVDETEEALLIGIVVNMDDYTIGADKGGAVNLFDDFDIDYNQYKYLIETRCSGALTKPHSALVIEQSHAIPAAPQG